MIPLLLFLYIIVQEDAPAVATTSMGAVARAVMTRLMKML